MEKNDGLDRKELFAEAYAWVRSILLHIVPPRLGWVLTMMMMMIIIIIRADGDEDDNNDHG